MLSEWKRNHVRDYQHISVLRLQDYNDKNDPGVMGSFPATFQKKKHSNLAKVRTLISCYWVFEII